MCILLQFVGSVVGGVGGNQYEMKWKEKENELDKSNRSIEFPLLLSWRYQRIWTNIADEMHMDPIFQYFLSFYTNLSFWITCRSQSIQKLVTTKDLSNAGRSSFCKATFSVPSTPIAHIAVGTFHRLGWRCGILRRSRTFALGSQRDTVLLVVDPLRWNKGLDIPRQKHNTEKESQQETRENSGSKCWFHSCWL